MTSSRPALAVRVARVAAILSGLWAKSSITVTPLALVLMVLVAPLKLITAVPLLPLTSMPPPCALDDRLPLKLTVPAVRPVTSIRSPAVVFATDALIVMAAVPPMDRPAIELLLRATPKLRSR